MSVYDFSVKTVEGKMISMKNFENKVLLIVNVASKCGLTPQYEGLEKLYGEHKAKGFEILGFPCNQFGAQEPGNEEEIKSFCNLNYNVSFPLFAKIEVNGPNADPLYEYLKSEKKGLLGTKAVKWNFTKFLVDRQGLVVKRHSPQTKPEALAKDIAALL